VGNSTLNYRSLTHTSCEIGNESVSVRYEPDGILLTSGRVSTMPDDRASAPRRREHADASGPASVT